MNRVIEHTPEDMTATVGAQMTLATLQTELARFGQWLPIDPPDAELLTVGKLIDINASGPRRFGYGTIRDFLIGIKVALADGTIIHSGGKVVKNVAGYDLMKLFIGAHGSLGTVQEATFKLRPLPEAEQFVQAQCETLEQADKLIEAVIRSEITPAVLDLKNAESKSKNFTVVLGFAGTREEVDWQMAHAGELGFNQSSSLDYETEFWSVTPDRLKAGHQAGTMHRFSVLPSKMIEAIRGLNGVPFVARAGNGVIYHRGPAMPRKNDLPLELMRRVKDAYDPKHLLPDLPL